MIYTVSVLCVCPLVACMHKVLRVTEPKQVVSISKDTAELEKRMDFLERKINLMSVLSPETEKKADRMLEDMGIVLGVDQEELDFNEKLELIIQRQKEKQEAEYKRIIAENNNNNNH